MAACKGHGFSPAAATASDSGATRHRTTQQIMRHCSLRREYDKWVHQTKMHTIFAKRISLSLWWLHSQLCSTLSVLLWASGLGRRSVARGLHCQRVRHKHQSKLNLCLLLRSRDHQDKEWPRLKRHITYLSNTQKRLVLPRPMGWFVEYLLTSNPLGVWQVLHNSEFNHENNRINPKSNAVVFE